MSVPPSIEVTRNARPAIELTRASAARAGLWTMLGRHQIAAMVSSAVDFGTMILAVELLGRSPVVATLLGATCGAITNFQLGRHWIFEARHEDATPQAVRYALVSGASAALNATGEYAAHDVLGLQYLVARGIVAIAVSLLWNFPMQRYFVFRESKRSARAGEEEGRA